MKQLTLIKIIFYKILFFIDLKTNIWIYCLFLSCRLSGLSPFMGETDVETMANVTIAKYDFDDEAFNDVSPEAKDFISKLLIKQISYL